MYILVFHIHLEPQKTDPQVLTAIHTLTLKIILFLTQKD